MLGIFNFVVQKSSSSGDISGFCVIINKEIGDLQCFFCSRYCLAHAAVLIGLLKSASAP